jgi:hypothetical protein
MAYKFCAGQRTVRILLVQADDIISTPYFCSDGCHDDVSPTDLSSNICSKTIRPLDFPFLGQCVPDRCVPTMDIINAVVLIITTANRRTWVLPQASSTVPIVRDGSYQGVTKRCRLSWLTNSALLYNPKCGGRGELRDLSQ